MAKNKQPVKKFRFYNVSASIWENKHEGGAFYAVTFERSYRTEDGAHQNSHSYSGDQVRALVVVANQAADWMQANQPSKKKRAA